MLFLLRGREGVTGAQRQGSREGEGREAGRQEGRKAERERERDESIDSFVVGGGPAPISPSSPGADISIYSRQYALNVCNSVAIVYDTHIISIGVGHCCYYYHYCCYDYQH